MRRTGYALGGSVSGHGNLSRWTLSALAAAASLASHGGFGPLTKAAEAATPNLLWRDVTNVQILCLTVTDDGVDRDAMNRAVCEDARNQAARGAPVPVAVAEPGDPAVLAPQTLTLLVHVSIQPDLEGRLAALSIRPFRNAEGGALLFAAAPRAARIAPSAREADALTGPLHAALVETLPWLASPAGPQLISP